jgi:hypothetical protein
LPNRDRFFQLRFVTPNKALAVGQASIFAVEPAINNG